MPLDKNDLKQIGKIVDTAIDKKVGKIVDTAIDGLAVTISRGFAAIDERFDRLEERMCLNRRVAILEKQVLKPH
jgi:hypothetical protein